MIRKPDEKRPNRNASLYLNRQIGRRQDIARIKHGTHVNLQTVKISISHAISMASKCTKIAEEKQVHELIQSLTFYGPSRPRTQLISAGLSLTYPHPVFLRDLTSFQGICKFHSFQSYNASPRSLKLQARSFKVHPIWGVSEN